MFRCPVCNASGIKHILKWTATNFDGIDTTKYRCAACGHRWQDTPQQLPIFKDEDDPEIEMYVSPYGGDLDGM